MKKFINLSVLVQKKKDFFFKLPGLEKDAEVVDFKLLSEPFIFSQYLEVFKLSHVLHIYSDPQNHSYSPSHFPSHS